MEFADNEPITPVENYYRQQWAIHLFGSAQLLLETYRRFPGEIRLQVRDGEIEEARKKLVEHYRAYPNVPKDQLADSATDALVVLTEGNDILVDMAELHESDEPIELQPNMDYETNLLFQRVLEHCKRNRD